MQPCKGTISSHSKSSSAALHIQAPFPPWEEVWALSATVSASALGPSAFVVPDMASARLLVIFFCLGVSGGAFRGWAAASLPERSSQAFLRRGRGAQPGLQHGRLPPASPEPGPSTGAGEERVPSLQSPSCP